MCSKSLFLESVWRIVWGSRRVWGTGNKLWHLECFLLFLLLVTTLLNCSHFKLKPLAALEKKLAWLWNVSAGRTHGSPPVPAFNYSCGRSGSKTRSKWPMEASPRAQRRSILSIFRESQTIMSLGPQNSLPCRGTAALSTQSWQVANENLGRVSFPAPQATPLAGPDFLWPVPVPIPSHTSRVRDGHSGKKQAQTGWHLC